MPVTERLKKQDDKTEKEAQEFISQGPEKKKEYVSFTLKITKNMAQEIDDICNKHCAYISRRSWIVQTIAEKLESLKND